MKFQEDEDSAPTVDLARKDVIFHKRIYGSVEALDGENQSEERNRRFRIETCSDHQVCKIALFESYLFASKMKQLKS